MSLGSMPPEPIPTNEPSPVGVVIHDAPETASAVASGMLPAGKPRSTFRRGLEVFMENKLAVTGVCIFVFMILFCFIGPHIYVTNQLTVDFAHEELSPSGSHLLGTDANGFDVLGRLMIAGQISLEVGIAAAILAGYFVYSAVSEERYMTERFPDAYPEYKAHSKMLIPFVF